MMERQEEKRCRTGLSSVELRLHDEIHTQKAELTGFFYHVDELYRMLMSM